jgi:hypothetical protein
MKRLFLVSTLFVLLFTACGTSSPEIPATPTDVPLPVLVVDEQHMTTVNLEYEVPAGDGFVLDASKYEFSPAGEPALVQVVVNGRVFQGNWASGATSQAVRAAELKPLAGSSQLTGFSAGQQLIISIGYLKTNGRFSPLWVAVVNIN